MKDDVLRQMDGYGSHDALRALVEGLPEDIDIVVKEGVGDWLPLAARPDCVAGVYMNRDYLHLLLQPDEAHDLVAVSGCKLQRINKTTGYVRVRAAEAAAEAASLAPFVLSAMTRSAKGPAPSRAAPVAAGAGHEPPDSDLLPELTLDPFVDDFDLPCVVFRISRLWYPGMPDDELYEATRGWWRMGPRREQAPYAVAVAGGVVRGVYVVDQWLPRLFEDDGVTRREVVRWGFDGQPAEDYEHLVGLDISNLFPQGSANPVTYFNLEGADPAPPSVWTTTAPPVEKLTELQSLVARLHDNPVLVMSLHSKELFHSNLLGWVVEKHPSAAAEALAPWLTPDPTRDVLRVRREKNHLDLIIELPGYAPLVIENKVFSLPDEQQLRGYAEKNIPAVGIVGCTRVLLSLLDPGWAGGSKDGWVWAPWTAVTRRIAEQSELAGGSSFDAQLVRYWIELVQVLDRIAALVGPSDLLEPLHLDADTLELLAEVRLGDAMQKFRAFAVRTLIADRLCAAGLVVDEVESSFGKGQVLLSVKVAVSDGSTVGWQLQGAQWRRFVMVPEYLAGRTEASKAARIAYVDQHHTAWVDFGVEQDLGPFAAAPSTAYKHFAPDFLYDYVRMPGLSIDTLLELAERVASEAVRYSNDFSPAIVASGTTGTRV